MNVVVKRGIARSKHPKPGERLGQGHRQPQSALYKEVETVELRVFVTMTATATDSDPRPLRYRPKLVYSLMCYYIPLCHCINAVNHTQPRLKHAVCKSL